MEDDTMGNRILILILAANTLISFAHAQYIVRSPYMQNPDLAIGYVDSCARFWFRAYDSTYGGFYTNVDRFGNAFNPLDKNLVAQNRDAYGFVRAYMLTGDTTFLVMARRALNFLYQHAWDNANGGWHAYLDRFGNPTFPTSNKSAVEQHYALLGVAAYYEATRDTTAWRWLMRGYASEQAHLWDARPQFKGYYESAGYNWAWRGGKSLGATIDAVTTHVLLLYLMMGEDQYRTRLSELGQILALRIAPTIPMQAIGVVERFDSDWNADNSYTQTWMGLVLKAAWCLGRIHQLVPDTIFITAAESLASHVWQRAYDHVYGAPYKDYDRVTGQMIMYGSPDTGKAWWQIEQAITGGLMLYEITGRAKYLQMADESVDFYMRYFVDRQYGEVYADRTRRGGFLFGDAKGNTWKAAYHSTELGYYLYLYGNLFVHQRPVRLHYRILPDTADRTLRMNPIAFQSAKYRIKQVQLNGTPYMDFIAGSRLLHVPPGIGGNFVVEYETTAHPVPIQLASFTARHRGQRQVLLEWTTLSEINNYGFEVMKASGSPSIFVTIPRSFVPGHGTTIVPHSYSFTDTAASNGRWYYRLKQIDFDGSVHFTHSISVDVPTTVRELVPEKFALEQNYPNPFNPTTEVRYQMSEISNVSLTVCDVLGRQVATLVNGRLEPGTYAAKFDASNLSSGVYYYQLRAGGFVETKRMIVLR
jgi:mannose/cellobiose epimerase-like protein (N-acyl-D-glucosamine 2-epimerase family)